MPTQHGIRNDNVDPNDYTKRTPREKAFKAIITERLYQDEKYPGPKGLVHQVRLVIKFADKLEKVKAGTDYKVKSLDIMRELAALCVRTMEQYGTVERG